MLSLFTAAVLSLFTVVLFMDVMIVGVALFVIMCVCRRNIFYIYIYICIRLGGTTCLELLV